MDVKKEEIQDDEEDVKRQDHNLLCEGCLGEQAFWFFDDQKCDVLELYRSSSGFSWMITRKGVKVGQPIYQKHGSNLNTAYGQADAWEKIKKMDPELLFINNPSRQSARNSFFVVLKGSYGNVSAKRSSLWQVLNNLILHSFLTRRWHKVLNSHLCWERVDIQHFCNCPDKIKDLKVYHFYDEYSHDVAWFEYLKVFFMHESRWNDPNWKYLPSRFIASLMKGFPE